MISAIRLRTCSLALSLVLPLLGSARLCTAQTSAPSTDKDLGIDPEEVVEEALDLFQAGDYQRAARIHEELMKGMPTLPKLKLLHGLLLMVNQKGQEALAPLEMYNATEEAGKDHRGFAAVGSIYMQSRMYKMALFPLERAQQFAPIEENGKHIRAQIGMDLAMAQLGLNRTKKAIEQAKLSAASAGNDAEIQMRLGQIAAQANELAISMEAIKQALSLFEAKRHDDPFSMDLVTKMRTCFQVLDKLHSFKVNSDPKNAENYFDYARMVLKASDLDHAASLINSRNLAMQALERNPDKVDCQLLVVQLEFQLGGVNDARTRLAEVVRKNPEHAAARQLQQSLFPTDPGPAETSPAP